MLESSSNHKTSGCSSLPPATRLRDATDAAEAVLLETDELCTI